MSELGATKIALGHHRDDILQTLLLNMFYGGKLKGMPPKLQFEDGKNVVIRPLAYVKERDLEKYAELREFPIIPCNLCSSQPNLKRAEIKALINEWNKRFPGRTDNMFNALTNVVPSHRMDRKLFGFSKSRATGRTDPQGDIAFDEKPCASDAQSAPNAIPSFSSTTCKPRRIRRSSIFGGVARGAALRNLRATMTVSSNSATFQR